MANSNPETYANEIEQLGHYLDYVALNFRTVDNYFYGRDLLDEQVGWFRLLLAAENGELQS